MNQCWENIELPPQSLAFTWCQIPILYQLTDGETCIVLTDKSEQTLTVAGKTLSYDLSQSLFTRQSTLHSIKVMIPSKDLLKDVTTA